MIDEGRPGDAGKHILARIRRARMPDAAPDPTLLDALAELTGAAALATAGRLLARVPVERIVAARPRLRPLRVAVSGTFTAENVPPLLRVQLLRAGIAPEIHVTGFDQLAVQLSDPDSALARFRPDLTLCLLHDRSFLPPAWDPTALQGVREVLGDRLAALDQAVAGFAERTSSIVLLHTVPLSATEHRKVIGYEGKALLGRIWRELNCGLLELAESRPLVHTLDLETILVDHPAPVRDDRLYRFAAMAWSPAVELRYAEEAAKFARAVVGLARKVLVLDLDNTLWGGVLGDDGPTGIQVGGQYPGNCYTELQRSAAALRQQGVLLAVCSKNDQSMVDDVLAHHPELTLRADDFVAQAVNWGRKDHNVREIARGLNIGVDSIVFADDSRFECDLIRQQLPEVEVVHLAGDPAGHVPALLEAGRFDVLTTTATDRERTRMYRARSERHRFAASFASAADYLSGLGLRVAVRPANDFSLPRLVQLGRRTNQFNLIGAAHSEARTRAMATSPDHLVLGFEVADRFGEEGIVGAVWVAKHPDHWLIENFVMSCRVFSRGVEQAVLSAIVDGAAGAGVPTLGAVYRPGERNRPAGEFLDGAGFVRADEAGHLVRYDLPLLPAPSAPVLLPDWIVLEGKGDHVHV